MSEKEVKDTVREGLVLDQDNIYEINLDSRIISWNAGAERMYGWAKKEVIGKTAFEVFKTKFHLNMYGFITKTMENYVWTGELAQKKRDGTEIIVSSHAILHRGGDGRPEGIIFVNSDITASKRIEEALKISEEKFSVTLNSIGDGVLTTDNDGRVTMMNPVSEQLTGWTEEQAKGQPVEKIFRIVSHKDRLPVKIPVKEALASGKTQALSNHTILIARDGGERHIADSCAPVRNRDGKITGVVLVFRDVTARVENDILLEKNRLALAEAKISGDEYREYLESIINTVRESLVVLDKNLKVVSVSRSFCKFFRVKSGEIVGRLFYELKDRQWDIKGLREMLEGILPKQGVINNYEITQEFADVGKRVMLLNCRMLLREQGRENLIFLVIEDITERKNALEALKRINSVLRTISNVNQTLMHVKKEGQFLDKTCGIIVKDRVYKYSLVSFDENDGKRSIRAMAAAGSAGAKAGLRSGLKKTLAEMKMNAGAAGTAISTGKTAVYRRINDDPAHKAWRNEADKYGCASIAALPLKSDGRVFGALTLFSAEPDPFSEAEIKLLEELSFDVAFGIKLLNMQEESRAAEKEVSRVATFPELDPNPISEINSAGEITYMNPAFRKLFFGTEKDIRKDGWFKGLASFFQALKGGKKEIVIRDIKAGEKHFMQTMVYVPAGKTIRTYGIDITERESARNEVKKLYDEMEVKVRQRTAELVASKHLADIGILAATVAHELRNPLGVINVAAYNIRQKLGKNGRTLSGHISNIEKKVGESSRIINNLLVYSRMKAPKFENADICKIILESADSVKNVFRNRNIRLAMGIKKIQGLIIEADPLQLKEVFINLMTNAFQAMDGRRGAVEVGGALKPGRKITVSVKDTGAGIKKEDMGNMFKPFFTRKTKGTGLGLVICKDLVHMHGGAIEIKSRQGRGSTFTVTLPVRQGRP